MSTATELADAVARGDVFSPMNEDDEPKSTSASKDDLKADDAKEEVVESKEEAVEEKDEEEKPKKGEPRIPLSRHKELLQKERTQREALERQLQNFQRGEDVSRAHEELKKLEDGILGMEKQYNKLMVDGEVERAADLMTKIRQAERQIVEAKSEARIAAATAQAAERARYDMALERIEEAYPVLNPQADEYDEERLADVAALKLGYQQQGMTPTQALQRAVKKLFPPTSSTQDKATSVAPRVTEKDIVAERKKMAAAKTAEVVGKQPANVGKAGEDNNRTTSLTAKDVMELSQDAFAKLSEEDLKKLRGDEL